MKTWERIKKGIAILGVALSALGLSRASSTERFDSRPIGEPTLPIVGEFLKSADELSRIELQEVINKI